MNGVAFGLSSDKRLREDKFFQPFRMVSLLELMRFHADFYLWVASGLIETVQTIRCVECDGIESIRNVEFDKCIEWLQGNLDRLELPVSAIKARKLLDHLNSSDENQQMEDGKQLTRDLHETLIDELTGKLLLMIPSGRCLYFEPEGAILGDQVVSIFPETREDADEAGKCFALGRYTACVFHLMRVMECIVRRLGKKLRIKFNPERDTWQRILKRVKAKIDVMPLNSSGQIKKQAKYQDIYLDLGAVKDAWRNPTMHPRATYTEEQAKKIIDKVRDFVRDFAALR